MAKLHPTKSNEEYHVGSGMQNIFPWNRIYNLSETLTPRYESYKKKIKVEKRQKLAIITASPCI